MAQAGPKPTTFYLERQSSTRSPATPAAPTVNSQGEYILSSLCAYGRTDPGAGTTRAGDGIWLTGLMAITISITMETAGTLTGGSLLGWLWSPAWNSWMRAPDLDLSVVAGTYTGPNGYAFAPMRVPNRMGQLYLPAANSLTGTSPTFLVRVDGFQSVLGMSTS